MSSRNYTAAYKSSNEKISHFYHSKQLVWLLIILGVGIRTYQYLANRALRGDEAYLVLNILNRSLPELWEPLDYSQAAPIGFLLLDLKTTGMSHLTPYMPYGTRPREREYLSMGGMV
jgi:hypothetical protein